MPVQMSFWGKEENKEAVLDRLKRHGFKLAPPLQGESRIFGLFFLLKMSRLNLPLLEGMFEGSVLIRVWSFTKWIFNLVGK